MIHSAAPKADRASLRGSLVDYLLLTKPWIVGLLIATTMAAMFVAQRGIPPLSLVVFTFLGGSMTAAGASTLNSYFDRDIDPLMGRTARRPIPAGKIAPRDALIFALALSAGGLFILGTLVNILSALLALVGLIYYSIIYTLILKRSTPQNIIIGGAAGAIPPMVGWAAVTGQLSLLAVYLFLIIFYWTPPHTWALMLMVKKDYERVHVPMMPVARGEPETRWQIVLYSVLLVAITLLPFSSGELGWLYLGVALALGIWFLFLAIRLWRDESKRTARKLYYYSNAYLALLFLSMVIDRSVFHVWL